MAQVLIRAAHPQVDTTYNKDLLTSFVRRALLTPDGGACDALCDLYESRDFPSFVPRQTMVSVVLELQRSSFLGWKDSRVPDASFQADTEATTGFLRYLLTLDIQCCDHQRETAWRLIPSRISREQGALCAWVASEQLRHLAECAAWNSAHIALLDHASELLGIFTEQWSESRQSRNHINIIPVAVDSLREVLASQRFALLFNQIESGETIDRLSRVLTVANAFDDLTIGRELVKLLGPIRAISERFDASEFRPDMTKVLFTGLSPDPSQKSSITALDDEDETLLGLMEELNQDDLQANQWRNLFEDALRVAALVEVSDEVGATLIYILRESPPNTRFYQLTLDALALSSPAMTREFIPELVAMALDREVVCAYLLSLIILGGRASRQDAPDYTEDVARALKALDDHEWLEILDDIDRLIEDQVFELDVSEIAVRGLQKLRNALGRL
jgi:hypothetical protein